LVLGDAGMGKTTFLINLFLTYNSGAFSKKYIVKFIPLGDIDADNQIKKLGDQSGKIILLLDGFDEDSKAFDDLQRRLNEIILMVKNFRKVIITCRTQFFKDEDSEKFTVELPIFGEGGGQHRINKKYICSFTDKEIRGYLNKRYGRCFIVHRRSFYLTRERKRAQEIVDMAPNLAVRPMLLDKMDDLLRSDRTFEYDYQVFEELVYLWIDRESKKQRNGINEFFRLQMQKFLFSAARKIYINFRDGDGLFITDSQIKAIAERENLDLSLIDLKTRSLLNRNPKGFIKFSHKTVLEYFLARIDTNAYSKENSIDFTTFNYGLKMRNQILIRSIQKKSKIIFIQIGEWIFKGLKHNENLSYSHVKSILISDNIYADNFDYRVFPCLKDIFILNMKEETLSKIESIYFETKAYTNDKPEMLILKYSWKESLEKFAVKIEPANEPLVNGYFINNIIFWDK
jgi:hypothetical protein